MNVFTIEVAWGERLEVEIGRWSKRTGGRRSDLFKSVAAAMDCSRNTISKFVGYHDKPSTTQDVQRAYVLLAWLGCDPEEFGISLEDLPPRLLKEVSDLLTAIPAWEYVTGCAA